MTRRFTAPVAVHLLMFRGEEVLLLRRRNTGYEDGNYSVPAGHLDGGETVKEAAVREAREEVGVRIDPEDVSLVHVMHRREGKEERIDFFAEVRRWEGEVVNKEPEKCDDLRWSGSDDLPENVIPYIRRALECHRKGIWFDSFGFDGQAK
ncbi:NUDIX hydrolase [Staphylospora marina]|uniref:NUDIX hydrolase n=1 Tax=Staphylospora marina TaxID=2490858 RepID=UPI000F5BF6A9|nr:NUDIX domain-containing protein [Staphylospora marina]